MSITKLTVGKSTGVDWNRNKEPRKVNITDISIEDSELRVYFDESWNAKVDGLIYGDARFEKELNKYLQKNAEFGMKGKTAEYSEQGMQGKDFVSFDI